MIDRRRKRSQVERMVEYTDHNYDLRSKAANFPKEPKAREIFDARRLDWPAR